MNPNNVYYQKAGVKKENSDLDLTRKEASKHLIAGDFSIYQHHVQQKPAPTIDKFDLCLFLVRCRDLAKFDVFGSSDPFVEMEVFDERSHRPLDTLHFQTSVKKSDLNPIYNEQFLLRSLPKTFPFYIELRVFDWDRASQNDFMGRVVISYDVLKKFVEDREGLIYSKYEKLQQRPAANGLVLEPEMDQLQGFLHFILAPSYAELKHLTTAQLNPFYPQEIARESPTPRDKNDSAKSSADEDPASTPSAAASASASASAASSAASNTASSPATNAKPRSMHNASSSSIHLPATPLSPGSACVTAPTPEEEKERLEMLEKWKSMSDDEKKKRKEMLLKSRAELISTEQSYVSYLDILLLHFIAPLKSLQANRHLNISFDTLTDILNNLETLANFHKQFLPDLKKETEIKDEKSGQGPVRVIIRYSEFFKLYTTYMNGYEKCVQAINSLRNNKKFQEFLTNLRSSPEMKGLDLMSYLIMPVQRLPRYVLLLKELKRHTPPDSDDFKLLNEALRKMETIAGFVNEHKRKMENMSKLLEIQNKIGDGEYGTLIAPHRHLVRVGVMSKVSEKMFGTLSANKRIFYLFNDMLLWTTDSYKYKGHLDLAAASVEDRRKKDRVNMISLSTSKRHLLLQAESEDDLASWMAEISNVISLLQTERERAMQRKKERLMQKQKSYGTASGEEVTSGADAHEMITSRLVTFAHHNEEPAAMANGATFQPRATVGSRSATLTYGKAADSKTRLAARNERVALNLFKKQQNDTANAAELAAAQHAHAAASGAAPPTPTSTAHAAAAAHP